MVFYLTYEHNCPRVLIFCKTSYSTEIDTEVCTHVIIVFPMLGLVALLINLLCPFGSCTESKHINIVDYICSDKKIDCIDL